MRSHFERGVQRNSEGKCTESNRSGDLRSLSALDGVRADVFGKIVAECFQLFIGIPRVLLRCLRSDGDFGGCY